MPTLVYPFSTGQVNDEFHVQESMAHNLQNMYDHIFGAGAWGAGTKLSDFDGYGAPTATTGSATQDCSGGDFKVTFNATLDDMGGLDCAWDFEWDTDPLFPSPTITTGGTEPGSPPNGSASVSDSTGFIFSDGQTVYYRIRVRNKFNDANSDAYYIGSTQSITFDTPALQTPSWTNSTVLEDDVRVYFSVEYGDDETDFDLEFRINGGSAQTGAIKECQNANVGTGSNPKEQVWDLNELLSPGDTLEIRIKAKGDACNDDSPFSAWQTASAGDADKCPL